MTVDIFFFLDFNPERADAKRIYDTANFYHFMHSIALLGVPLCRRPYVVGILIITIYCIVIK